MGKKETLKRRRMEYAKQKAETQGYRRIVAERTKLASRQAYADEAVKVARERARAKAHAPTFGQKLGSYAKKKMAPPKQVTRKMAVSKPNRRRISYAVQPKQTAPSNLNQAIYGGY